MSSDLDVVSDGDEDSAVGEIDDAYQPKLDEGSVSPVFRSVRHHRGPMPSAEELMGYKYVDPTLPKSILEMAQKEQDHRHSMDRQELTEAVAVTKRGQILGVSIAAGVLILAGILALMGQPILAGIMAGLDVVGLAAVFVGTSKAQNRTE